MRTTYVWSLLGERCLMHGAHYLARLVTIGEFSFNGNDTTRTLIGTQTQPYIGWDFFLLLGLWQRILINQ